MHDLKFLYWAENEYFNGTNPNTFLSESKRDTCKRKWSLSDCANQYTIEF